MLVSLKRSHKKLASSLPKKKNEKEIMKIKNWHALIFCPLSLLPMTRPESKVEVSLDSYLQNQTDRQNFSGTALIAKKGKVLLKKGYGLANYELNVANAPAMKFRIGSLSKQFTALAVMQLQEKGLLKISDTLARYIPDFPNGHKITLHNLLTHTSGIFNISTMPDIIERAKQSITLEKLVERIKKNKPEFAPGDHYSYNNSGYILLTHIIEKITGKPYEQYLQENIFNPLGMQESGIDDPIQIIPNRAAGYSKDTKGLINAPYTDMAWTAGAGQIYSTIEDLYRWHVALQSGKLLAKESVKTLMAAHVQMETANEWYGYGLYHIKNTKFGPLIGHRGKTLGFHSALYYYPEHDIVIIILSNFMFAPLKESILDALAALVIQ